MDELFRAHLAERGFWELVAQAMGEELTRILRHRRIQGKVEARAKTTGSVIGKAYRKPDAYSQLQAFGDLAAARALVPFPSDVEMVAAELHGHPHLRIVKDESKSREASALTYQARHLDVVLEPEFWPEPPEGLITRTVTCEVQIQTFSQSLWASVSHLVTYKRTLPDEVTKRINRLIVLCELFDDEVEHARSLALANVDAVGLIADEVSRYFYGITGEVADVDATLEIVGRLLPALAEDELHDYPTILDRFVQQYAERLAHLLTNRPEVRGLPWLLRPEILMILERMTNRPARLESVWDAEFLQSDREALAAAWGPIG